MDDIATIISAATVAHRREQMEALHAEVAALPQVDLPLRHFFAEGVYGREIFIPAGHVAVGKVHLRSFVCVITQGDVSLFGDGGAARIQAPHVATLPAGTKRAAFAHEDTRLITFHGTHETDIEALERELVVLTRTEYEALHGPERPLLEV